MSSSIPSHKFLIDENVKAQLFKFLTQSGFDVILVPKSAPDKLLASISKTEKRVLVTNDEDFSKYADHEIFAVVWLRIPQAETKSLINIFNKLAKEVKDFSKKFIILTTNSWEEFPLLTEDLGGEVG